MKKTFIGGKIKLKKLLIIIFLMLSLFPIMAGVYQTSSVTIRTTVSTISLSQAVAASDGMRSLYQLSGSWEDQSKTDLDYLYVDDISAHDVTVYFSIDQLAKTRTDETIQLSVTADKLVNTEAGIYLSIASDYKVETDEPVVSVVSCTDIPGLQVTSVPQGRSEFLFTLRYMDYRPLENINILVFKTTWNKTTGLAPGLYTSEVTLSYITN